MDRGLAVLDLLANPMWHADANGQCDWLNRAWLAFTGRAMAEEVGNGWVESLHPEDREPCLAHFRDCFRARQQFQWEYRLRHHDGSYRWFVSTGSPEFDPEGRFLGYFGCCHDIQDRKAAKARLLQERLFLDAILESVDSIIAACDREGRLLLHNRLGRELSGQGVTEAPPEQWAQVYGLLDPESGEFLAPEQVPLYRAWKGEQVVDQEIDMLDIGGRRRRLIGNGRTLRGQSGELLGAVASFKDVTAQREAEEQKRREHGMKHAIASILTVSVGTASLQAKTQEALESILKGGFLTENKAGYVALRLVVEEEQIAAAAATPAPLPRRALDEYSFPVVVDGQEIGTLQVAMAGCCNSRQREFFATISILFASMIQRTRYIDKITQLSQVVEQIHIAILITDAAGKIQYANPALCRSRGYALPELIGARLDQFDSGSSPDEVYRRLRATIASGQNWSGELQNRGRDGRGRWERVTIFPIRDGNDTIVNFVACCEDLTSAKQAERERMKLESRLAQAEKMEAIGHLSGGIAHDFNNILVAVLGFTELAQSQFGSIDSKLASYLDHSMRASLRAKELVKQLLAFSRSSPLEARSLAPGPVVEEVVKLLRSTIPSSLSITLAIPDDLPCVRINPVQLHQVMMNLCINARDATGGRGRIDIVLQEARGGPETETICASCHKAFSGDYVRVVVRDDGKGITAIDRGQIFDPFFTTKEVGQGTGMGLSVVHGIVHLHGGHVTLASSHGDGAEFAIYLPVAPRDDTQAAFSVTSPIASVRGQVLVIDDERPVTEFTREVLEDMGCRVTLQTDAQAAWEWFVRAPQAVDLVIVDQTMPHLTGSELCSRMLALRPELPIILWTGFSAEVDEDSASRLGIRRFLLKPVSSADLRTAVGELLGDA